MRPQKIETVQFLLALFVGGLLGGARLTLSWTVFWVLTISVVLTVITLIVEGRQVHHQLPVALRSPYGLTVPRGKFSYLFFGTITTITIATGVVALLPF
jgi:hypothetical protein